MERYESRKASIGSPKLRPCRLRLSQIEHVIGAGSVDSFSSCPSASGKIIGFRIANGHIPEAKESLVTFVKCNSSSIDSIAEN
jgi:hypothetical protein